jgi:dihydroorotate dehydrogenase
MGLEFSNPLGLAAGFDRTGKLLGTLAPLGFGHIEVGTVTPASANFGLATTTGNQLRIGASIGSARMGISQPVVDDYIAALSRVWGRADYIVANLSSPFVARNGDTPGVDALIEHVSASWCSLRRESGLLVPLLVKVACTGSDGISAAIAAARGLELSGIVLVSASLRQISAVRQYLDGAAVISVGGVASALDVKERMSAGASLVQIYTTFVREGPAVVRRILADLEGVET